MNDTPPINPDRLRPYLRIVVLAAWLGWGALAAIAWLFPAAPERRAEYLLVLAAGAIYVLVVSRILFLRYYSASWFPYALAVTSVGMLSLVARAFQIFTPAFDTGVTVILVLVLLISHRYAAFTTGILGALAAALLEWGQVDTATWAYGLIDRLVIYGTLTVLISEAMAWSAQTWRESTLLAERSAQQAARQLRELRALHDLTTGVSSSLDLNHVLDLAMTRTLAALQMDAALIALIDETTQTLKLRAHCDLPQELADQIALKPLPLGEGLSGRVAQDGHPRYSEEVGSDPRVANAYIANWGYKAYFCIALKAGGQIFGIMNILGFSRRAPDDDELAFLEALGEQVGLAVRRAQSYAVEQKQRTLAESLVRVAQVVGEGHDLRSPLDAILAELNNVVPYASASIMLLEERTLQVSAARGHPAGTAPLDTRFAADADTVLADLLRGGLPIVLQNTHASPGWQRIPGYEYIHSWAGAPLLHHGTALGVLSVDRTQLDAFRADEIELLSTFAAQAAAAIDKARLFRQAERRLQQLGALNQVGQAIGAELELSHVLQLVYEQVVALTGNRDFFIALYDERTDEVSFPLFYEKGERVQLEPRRHGLGMTEEVIRTRKPLMLNNDIVEFNQSHGIALIGMPSRSWLGVPLLKGDRVIGVMTVQNYEQTYAYDDEDLELFRTLAGQVAVAVENARLYENTQRNLREATVLFEFSRKVSQSSDVAQTALAAAIACRDALPGVASTIYGYQDEDSSLLPLAFVSGAQEMAGERAVYFVSERAPDALPPASVHHCIQEQRIQKVERPAALDTAANAHLCVPILIRDRGLGAILIEAGIGRGFVERDEQFAQTLAGQLAVALEGARLRRLEERRTRELASLYEVSQAFGAMGDLYATFAEITRRLAQIFHTQCAVVMLYDPQRRVVQAQVPGYGASDEQVRAMRFALDGSFNQAWNPATEPAWIANDPTMLPDNFQQVLRRYEMHHVMGAAMNGRRGLMGLLFVANGVNHRAFTKADSQLLAVLAHQAALAIENAQLVETERNSRQQLQLVNRIARRISSLNSLQGLAQEIATAVEETFHYQVAQTMLVEGDELVKRGGAGTLSQRQGAEYRQSLNQGIFGYAARSGTTYVAADVTNDPLYVDYLRAGIRSEAAIPLRTEGHVIGLLVVASTQPDAISISDITTLETVADQAAQAIANVRLYESEQRRANQLATISDFGREIASLLTRDELLNRAVQLIHERFGYYAVHIFLSDSQGEMAIMAKGVRTGNPAESGTVTLQIGKQGLIGKAIAENRVICENDVLQNPHYHAVSPFTFIRSELVVPIRQAERVLGALDAQDDRFNAFGEEDISVLQTLADQLAVAVVNAELHSAVEYQAHTDSLTGVYNHGYFLSRLTGELAHAERTGQPLSLIMLDIDFFKQYNDRYGHVIGDRVLQLIAQAIRQNIKHEDLVGRWGGEEFTIALPNTSAPQAMIVAERIRRTLAAMDLCDNAGGPINKPTISQGIATYPDHATNAESLVDRADRMLYQAKEHGRDQVVQYQRQMGPSDRMQDAG